MRLTSMVDNMSREKQSKEIKKVLRMMEERESNKLMKTGKSLLKANQSTKVVPSNGVAKEDASNSGRESGLSAKKSKRAKNNRRCPDKVVARSKEVFYGMIV